MSTQYSGLAHSLVRLVSGQSLPPPSHDHVLEPEAAGNKDEGAGELQSRRAREWCVQNEQGAYTFREEDEEGLGLAKAVQAAGEALAGVAKLYVEQVSLAPTAEELELGVQVELLMLRRACRRRGRGCCRCRSSCVRRLTRTLRTRAVSHDGAHALFLIQGRLTSIQFHLLT